MTRDWIVTLLVAGFATFSFGGVALWGWLTPNGPAWQAFRTMCTALASAYGLWLYAVLTEPHRYQGITVRLWLVYGALVVASVYAAALALRLRKDVLK